MKVFLSFLIPLFFVALLSALAVLTYDQTPEDQPYPSPEPGMITLEDT